MRRLFRCSRYLAIALAILAGSSRSAWTQVQDSCPAWDFCLYIPAFDGPDALGLNVATVLNLQIWGTFRQKPFRRPPLPPSPKFFGNAGIVWDTKGLPQQRHEAAARILRRGDMGGQMALWGKAYPFGNGTAVQPRLTMPLYEDGRETRNEIWRVKIGKQTISADLPARRYELPPILLGREAVSRYSRPNALAVYSARFGGSVRGRIGNSFVGRIIERDRAKIRTNGYEGWIRFPSLNKRRSGVVEFISALIRIYRTDWEGAATALGRVLEDRTVRPRLKHDARLLLGMSRERDGKNGRPLFEAALEIDHYSQPAVKYLILSYLREYADTNPDRRTDLRNSIEKTLTRYRVLFSAGDPWVKRALSMAK